MKKVLVSLLVLALATASAFAAVDFTGKVVAGYTFDYYNDEWAFTTMGEDGVGSAPIKLNATVADENGYWDVTMKGALVADSRVGGNANVNLGKIIMGADSDLSIKIGMYANDRITGYRAYTNQSGLNLDRVRTYKPGLWFNLDVAYGDLVAVQVGGGPKLSVTGESAGWFGTGEDASPVQADLIVSAIVRPLDGVAISAAYTMTGDCAIYGEYAGNGLMNVEASVDLGKLLGTDWTFGLDVADKMSFKGDTNPFANLFLVSVYGGIDMVKLALEYGLLTVDQEGVDAENYLSAGLDLNVLEGLILNAYFGAFDLAHFNDTWFIGANLGYQVYDGVTFQVNVQYAEPDAASIIGGDYSQGSVKAPGFSITPKMVIEF